MCGIVAGCSEKNLLNHLYQGLKNVEYRGYDSAGISFIQSSQIQTIKKVGKVNQLADCVEQFEANVAIAHTRWATHGPVTEHNAHPHTSTQYVSVVHNGIIENYLSIKNSLVKQGYPFASLTDSEVIPHLLHYYWQKTQSKSIALQKTIQQLEGSFSIVALFSDTPDQLFGACQDSPLILGVGDTAHGLASDALALTHWCKQSFTIPNRHIVLLKANTHEIQPFLGEAAQALQPIENLTAMSHSKAGFDHYMLKEIHQQPGVWQSIISRYFEQANAIKWPNKPKHIHIIGCGSSFHAAQTAQYWFESVAKIPSMIHIASEYIDRSISVPDDCLLILPSQSGETADTLSALKKAKSLNYTATLALCNVMHSSLVQQTTYALPLMCGPEIGVASTKAFTAQLWLFFALANHWSDTTKLSLNHCQQMIHATQSLFTLSEQFQTLSQRLAHKKNVIFIGRELGYPTAMEAALKLKEISYIHAHAYPAGELKHGPLALVDHDLPVIASMIGSNIGHKMMNHLEEVQARHGDLIIFHQLSNADLKSRFPNASLLALPACYPALSPMLFSVAYQMAAYYIAKALDKPIDQPRNLAKSVTVE